MFIIDRLAIIRLLVPALQLAHAVLPYQSLDFGHRECCTLTVSDRVSDSSEMTHVLPPQMAIAAAVPAAGSDDVHVEDGTKADSKTMAEDDRVDTRDSSETGEGDARVDTKDGIAIVHNSEPARDSDSIAPGQIVHANWKNGSRWVQHRNDLASNQRSAESTTRLWSLSTKRIKPCISSMEMATSMRKCRLLGSFT